MVADAVVGRLEVVISLERRAAFECPRSSVQQAAMSVSALACEGIMT